MGVKEKGQEVKKRVWGLKNRRRLRKKGLGVKKKGYPYLYVYIYISDISLRMLKKRHRSQ